LLEVVPWRFYGISLPGDLGAEEGKEMVPVEHILGEFRISVPTMAIV
jgi:hypothetical protein